MLAEKKTRLHDDVIAVLALHTSPRIPLPRTDTNALCYKLINCYRSHLLQYQQCCRFLLYSCFVQYFSLILWLFLFEFPYMHGTECLFIVVRK